MALVKFIKEIARKTEQREIVALSQQLAQSSFKSESAESEICLSNRFNIVVIYAQRAVICFDAHAYIRYTQII